MTENPTRKFYDRISNAYDAIADGGEHKARERGLGLLAVRPGERVLEIGYGTGHSLVALAQAAGDGGRVTGIDISEGMREVATRRIADAGLGDHVDLQVGVAPPLPYQDDAFDVAFMSFTLELFPLDVIPEVLRECARVLRSGARLGVVSMATPLPGETDSALEQTYKWFHTHFPHIVDCQPIPAEKLLADAGFQLAQSERLSIFTMPVAALVGTRS